MEQKRETSSFVQAEPTYTYRRQGKRPPVGHPSYEPLPRRSIDTGAFHGAPEMYCYTRACLCVCVLRINQPKKERERGAVKYQQAKERPFVDGRWILMADLFIQ